MSTSCSIQRAVPEAVEPRGAAGQVDKADRRLHQLMQRQPQVLGVALLREVERKQKDRQEQQQDRITSRGSRSNSVWHRP